MALQAGNRTYYNPTHGIDWRGNLLPFNTFYAIMSLCLFFVLALILRLCYRHYRFEIRRAGIKQEEAKKKYEKAMAYMIRMSNGAPPGILKNTGSLDVISNSPNKVADREEDLRGEPRVQFSEEIKINNFEEAKDSDFQKKVGESNHGLVKNTLDTEGKEDCSHL